MSAYRICETLRQCLSHGMNFRREGENQLIHSIAVLVRLLKKYFVNAETFYFEGIEMLPTSKSAE